MAYSNGSLWLFNTIGSSTFTGAGTTSTNTMADYMGQIQGYGGLAAQLGMQQAMQQQQYPYPYNYHGMAGPSEKIPEPEDEPATVHAHLQRRVNKWLKGVDLPLH